MNSAGAESGLRRVSRRIPAVAAGLALAGVCLVLSRVGEVLGMPAPQLLIATVAGAAVAVLSKAERAAPARTARASHALIGVLMGSYLRPEALQDATEIVLASLAATIATIVVCTLTALLLARLSAVTRVDALLGLAPGGSASIIASASELGADAWQVACAQYLRVAMVAVTAPLLVVAVTAHTQPSAPAQHTFAWPDVAHVVEQPGGIAPLLVLTAVCVLGSQLGTKLRLPAPALLGSAVLTVVVTFTGTATGFGPDGVLQDVVLVMAGLEVGLRFSRSRLRATISVLPHLVMAIAAVCVACGGIAWVFGSVTGVGFVHAYLATTPGGITAVLAATASMGTDMTVVSTAQCVRLIVVALVVPLLIRVLAQWRTHDAAVHSVVENKTASKASSPRVSLSAR
ncbi:AbrB family transcriptional regulator [Lentzea sp. NPDC092896]|uniref:AbrB family transcriptional regulator n=1 Tax=Lentzea sp. NPDC092896 TaxID=3364127 RepID=UPI0037F22A97